MKKNLVQSLGEPSYSFLTEVLRVADRYFGEVMIGLSPIITLGFATVHRMQSLLWQIYTTVVRLDT